jgi:hypothetical protein
MKLLATITALLLSFSAFSQDLIEYNQGTFSRNVEELSIQEVEQLTKELNVGWYAKRCLNKGKRANNIANNRLHRNSVAVIATGVGGLASYNLFVMSAVANYLDWRVLEKTFYGLGVVMIPSIPLLAISSSRQEYWIKQRDDSFIRLAEKLNQAEMKSE